MGRYQRIFVLAFWLFSIVAGECFAQSNSRRQNSINDGWKFLPKGAAYAETVQCKDADWEQVSLPHTWNATDPFDDDRTYRRGIGWYRKELVVDQQYKGKRLYLYFEGANQLAHVYVNGYFAGLHKGGYTGFAIDITNYINWKAEGKNIVAVQVSNAHDPFIPPLNVGYASYGGIYRDAWLIVVNKIHFATIDNNSSGVYISTPSVSKDEATLAVRSTVRNETGGQKSFEFINTLYDADGKEIQSFRKTSAVLPGQDFEVSTTSNAIKSPRLWSPLTPYLYKLISSIVVDGIVVDEVQNSIGFRWFNFDAATGFSLNGQKLFLRGTNRHQDMKGKGDALSAEDHRGDMEFIKNMGCNFVRLAHYPQAVEVLKLADELGLLVWEETPVVNFVTTHPEFLFNSQTMISEMITQGFNHPSVILWGSTNEVFLHGSDGERIGRQNDSSYVAVVKNFVQKLDSTVRSEDPSRYSTMAMHISADYTKYGLDTVAQVAGYNIYSGWYSGKVEDLSNDLDGRKRSGHVVFVSEYGAEGEVRLNTETPIRFDYTGQYQRYFHEAYLRQFNARPWLAGTAIWNQFDFSQPNIGGPAPHMNQKGVATWDRKPKDVYYMYKANWNLEPMVYIASRDWAIRGGEIGAPSTIDVYSNGNEISLSVNGKLVSTKKVNDMKKASWQVLLKDGVNSITASSSINGKVVTDNFAIEYKAYSSDAKKLKAISINVGSNTQYTDAANHVWVEDRPYKNGSFGYTGGTAKVFDRKEVIMNTDDEPMFYTYRDSIQGYRFDVADGQYRITLCFAEAAKLQKGERIFDVQINNQNLAGDIDLTATAGFAKAVANTFVVNATGGEGVQIKFDAKKGGAVLNGIKLQKL